MAKKWKSEEKFEQSEVHEYSAFLQIFIEILAHNHVVSDMEILFQNSFHDNEGAIGAYDIGFKWV